jgi:hypothetical protein
MKLQLKEILDNPFRDLIANPLKKEKLKELENSIHDTGFWDNVMVRKNSEGKYELAYGHHRKQAAINAGFIEADFIVKELSDTLMLQIMDNENRETYGTDLLSIMESVCAVVKALGSGRIEPFVQSTKVRSDLIRYAPSFILGKTPSSPESGDHTLFPYTAIDVARFLGRTRKEGAEVTEVVNAAFDVLELQEEKIKGWSRAELITRYESLRIPVEAVLIDAKTAKKNTRKRRASEKKKSEEAEAKGTDTKAQLSKLTEEDEVFEEKQERLDEEYAKAERDGHVAKAKRIREERKQIAKDKKEHDKLVDEARRADKKADKTAAKKAEAAKKKEEKAAAKAAQNWLNLNQNFIGRLDRIFSDADGLYAELKIWKQDKRTTEEQRQAMQLALQRLSNRAANFNPFTGKPITKEKQ